MTGNLTAEFAVLGPMAVTAGGTPVSVPAKQRVVLAALLLRANRVVPAESIIEELWDADPPASARNTTAGYVARLRRILPAGGLITRAPGYLLNVGAGELDLHRFARLCDAARLAAGRRDWQDAAQRNSTPRPEAIALTHLAESHRSAGNIPAARRAWAQALVILDGLQLPDADQVRARLAVHSPARSPRGSQLASAG